MVPENIVILAKNQKAAKRAASVLDGRHIPYRLVVGTHAGHIGEVTEQITSEPGEHTLLIVGGDGLLNEVVNHVCDFSRVILGLIPAGSGNDFARALKISKTPETAITRILEAKRCKELDVGSIRTGDVSGKNEKQGRFMVSAGAGFDAAVCVGVDQNPLKKILSKLNLAQFIYTFAALPLLLRCRHVPARIYADGELAAEAPLFFAAAMNTAYEGGGYKFCPDADPADGLLELITVQGIRQWMVPGLLLLCRKGRHKSMRQIDLKRVRKITMEFREPVAVHTDGEVYGFAERIELEPSREKVRFLFA